VFAPKNGEHTLWDEILCLTCKHKSKQNIHTGIVAVEGNILRKTINNLKLTNNN
jgi:hypothetical protein